ncbi:MAG: peptidoglycan-binding protein [Nostoc sp. DedVER02]|uniref:peptidoglycan-binding domain-containing protein n=1 Tax=unclassified Nostoc TaxID=2593658 RepID=UPI002AD563F4|nr:MULTISPECIES: peptidoglycan-binding protein [unclassified Nostoc]MDZ7986454.1 peptidoglycan-binding protein [Nostoc sp. DedVER02]MDZ8114046.1 peptidoglycan-binding protein [Nostoc sp. DedVER01b]
MKTGVDSYLTKLASVFEASESIKVVPTVANFKFLNWKKLSSGTAMRLVSAAIITGLLSVAGQALALQKIGSNGPEVSSSQRCLKKLGYFNGPVSGKFASLTQNAVIRFQQANRIPADGVVGINTQQTLQRACQGRNTNSASRAIGQYPVLSQGKTGAAVTRLQQRLRQLGYLNANPNGNFGPKTKDAVIKFQRNYGIAANGIVNRQTWNALLGSSPTQARSSRSSSLSSQQVRELQVRLRQLGYFNTNPTGTIGPITKNAVIRFQQNYRLPVDGIADAQVLEAVRRASTGGAITQQASRDYLTVGDRGDNVALVQERLSQLGFSNTNPDGFFSDYTRESVIAFQQYSRINASGNVDWPTWQALGLNSVAAGNPAEANSYISPETPYLVPVNTGYATPENNRYVLPPANGYAVPGTNGNTLVANNPYRVIIPISGNDTLSKVQQYIPDAITEQSHLGDYVNAGAFSDRAQAETLTRKLRSLGLDARVKYN